MKNIALMIMACLCTIGTIQAQSEVNSRYRSKDDLYYFKNKKNNVDENLSTKGLITEFMSIPVDGYKPEMIKKLESKGFIYNEELDRLEGEFNGEDVYISIVTNNNKVWRIAVFDKNERNEQQIKVRFNRLCEQFENNKKYSFLGESQMIPEETDISYEMNVENKSFEALFHQEIDINQVDTILLKNSFLCLTDEVNESLKEKLNKEQVDKFKDIIKGNFGTELIMMGLKFKKHVWFKIFEYYGNYRIVMYYDNKHNEANGEDL